MINRSKRRVIAKQTVSILEAGGYRSEKGEWVDITEMQSRAEEQTRVFAPTDELEFLPNADETIKETVFTIENRSTFAVVRDMDAQGCKNVGALNFASAKNPGGGFLNGSQAQEEALARASGLYHCLLKGREYYDANRAHDSSVYTDHIILSPNVPIFRDDNDQLLDMPVSASIITAPAVNAGAVRFNEPKKVDQIAPRMLQRIERVLQVAILGRVRNLILGAWGCGVFQYNPAEVASLFRQALIDPRFSNAFDSVYFGVLDRTKDESIIRDFRAGFKM